VIYYIYFLYLLFLIILSEYKFKKNVKILFTCIAIFSFIIIGGGRFEVGADWFSYREFFDTVEYSNISIKDKEYLFLILNLIFSKIGIGFNIFVFIVFLAAFYTKYLYISSFTFNIPLALLIYFLTLFIVLDINGLRQGIAIGILFLTIAPNYKRQFIKFFILVFCASLFHYTAVVYLPFYFISTFKIYPKKIFLIVLFTFILTFFIENILINSIFGRLISAYENLQHYNYYVDNSETPVVDKFGLAVLSRLIILFIIVRNSQNIKINETLKNLLVNSYTISILLFLLLSFNQDFANRLSYYFRFVEIILVPLIVHFEKNRVRKYLYLFIFILIYFLSFLRIMMIPGNGLLPYNNSVFNIFDS
jgi:hypothetical protein